jgi:uncharacterized protein YjiS (DUF1127 family)
MFAAFTESSGRPSSLYRLGMLLRALEQRFGAAATRLGVWLTNRRIAAIARRDLNSMSDRELKDIGITRVDVERVAWGASDRDAP